MLVTLGGLGSFFLLLLGGCGGAGLAAAAWLLRRAFSRWMSSKTDAAEQQGLEKGRQEQQAIAQAKSEAAQSAYRDSAEMLCQLLPRCVGEATREVGRQVQEGHRNMADLLLQIQHAPSAANQLPSASQGVAQSVGFTCVPQTRPNSSEQARLKSNNGHVSVPPVKKKRSLRRLLSFGRRA